MARGREWVYILPPSRGKIFDKEGRVLASDKYIYEAYLDVDYFLQSSEEEDRKYLDDLLESFGLTEKASEVLNGEIRFLLLGRSENKDSILAKIPPPLVKFVSINLRSIRMRVKNCSVPGITGSVMDGKGTGGVEEFLDDKLKGKKAGRIVVEYRGVLNLQPVVKRYNKPVNGDDIRLSIDYNLQRIAYQILLKAVKHHHAESGNVIVMETRTGKIRAMVTTKSWNDNVLGVIEPGSSIKPIIYAIALETNAATPGFSHNCTGWIKPVDSLDIIIGDVKAHGQVDFRKALAESCNTATVKIAKLLKKKIGEEGIYNWLTRFGLGKKTGIEIADESEGILRKPEEWSAIDFAEVSIGQGIGTTPIQLIASVNTVLNNGIYVKPTILEDSTPVSRRIISESVADFIRDIMIDVVEKGTGELAKVPGLKIAGKTGTAQKAIGGIYVKKYHSIFIGAFPASDPKYTILVHINDPKGEEYLGGDVAAPVFADIVRHILGLSQEKPLIVYRGVMPDLKGLSLKDVKQIADMLGVKVILHGNGVVIRQLPAPGTLNPKTIEVWLQIP